MKILLGLLFTGLFVIQVAAQPQHVLNDSLAVYSAITGKTVLQPCQLPQSQATNLAQFPTNKPDAIVAIQKEFGKFGYEFVPVGDKFIMVVQTRTRTNALFAAQFARFQPPALNTNSSAATGIIHFPNADISQVLDIYSKLRRCMILKPVTLPPICITFRTQQSLTRDEVVYALNITMLLNGIVPIDDGGENVSIIPLDQASLEKFGSKSNAAGLK